LFALTCLALYNQRFTFGAETLSIPFIEQNDQTQARREHLEALRALIGNAYPNKFMRSNVTESETGEDTISALTDEHTIAKIVGDASFAAELNSMADKTAAGEKPAAEELQAVNEKLNRVQVRLSGRIASPPRIMGKAAFVHISDGLSRLQIYVRKADVAALNNDNGAPLDGEGKGWELFGLLDHGDFIGIAGYLFVTRTGELSVHVQELQFLAKALLPMPDKMHGISDPEIRQRQRYADLIAGSLQLEREEGDLAPREVFEVRSRVVREMRRFLDDHGYLEVETPMLTAKATGALARPFKTHHNALDIDLYARIAPELYLKRLVVGGFEKVYELNRNFRNEGIDRTHNPEFTMLEFYCAYMDVNGMMDFYEEMLRATVFTALGHMHVRYGEFDIDFAQPFQRLTMKEAIAGRGYSFTGEESAERIVELFEELAEAHLVHPTFITDFPKSVSPLSKASPNDPSIAERFELFIGAIECGNGFSELNDPEEQYQRFKEQAQQREGGDDEAMVMDEDYIRALSYGMPPAAGIGIGIDRLVMLLTNKHSIRDVILFPHMRPEQPGQ
jgi:lysyl-tRNA synthetase class 2